MTDIASAGPTAPLRIAVVGATGYAGAEVLRLLMRHPGVREGSLEIGALMAGSSAGTPASSALPHLPGLSDRTIAATDVQAIDEHDVVFLCLPHGHSAAIAQQLHEGVVVIDCAADFRLRHERDWQAYYDGPYAGAWPYGLPELPDAREQLQGSTRVAVPGCFPTGATLAAFPAVQAGCVGPELSVVSITGVSGGGKKASVGLLGAETMGSLRAYNTAGRHRHNPEIAQNLERVTECSLKVSFTPVLAPLPRGILTTVTAQASPGITETKLREVYDQAFGEEPFVQLLAPGQQPQTQAVVGANMCHVQVELDERSGTVLMTSAIDNLTKGTAGAAVQCMNLALGLPETAGLPTEGVAP